MHDRYFAEALKDPIASKGVAHLKAGKNKEGIKELQIAHKEHPDNWYVNFCLGLALAVRSETREEGISYLDRAATIETVGTLYNDHAKITQTSVVRQLELDHSVLFALRAQGTQSKPSSKCKRCGYEDTTTYKFGRRLVTAWYCLDCVEELMKIT